MNIPIANFDIISRNMRLLFRYIIREFFAPLVYCLIGFVGIYVLFELFGSFSRLVEAKLPAGTVIAYFAGYLAPFVHYLMPAALMLATLYTMWNFSRHCEITAMRASGISIITIVRPLMVAALVMGGVVAWFNEAFMPERGQWAKRFRAAHFDQEELERENRPCYKAAGGMREWTVGGDFNHNYSCFSDVRINWRPDENTMQDIMAEKAEYLDGEWWLTNPKTIHYRCVTTGRLAGTFQPVKSETPDLDGLSLRVYPQFRERPGDIQMQNCDPRFASTREKLRFLRRNGDLTPEKRGELRYDAWAQAISPLACLLITLLSVPAGLVSGRQAVFAGVLGALGFFFAYNAWVIGWMVLAHTGQVPAVPAALAPPIAFAVLGVFHCYRSMRATYMLLLLFTALSAVYVLLAMALERFLGMDHVFAHALSGTLPLLAAAAGTLMLRDRAARF